MFQTQSNYESQPFPWMVVLLAVQILLLAVILLVWAARLVKRGKHLARNPDEERNAEENEACGDAPPRPFNNNILLHLAKEHLRAQLSHDVSEISRAKESLVRHLSAVHEEFLATRELKETRQIVMRMIRCSCVKHPYDQTGRRMACLTKAIYKEEILQDFSFFHKLKKFFSVPFFIRESRWGPKVMMNIPIIIATLSTMYKILVYGYDIYTDANVIDEIDQNIDNFKIPHLNSTELGFQAMRNFTLDKIVGNGIDGMKEPCEFLKLTEDVFDQTIPFYKTLVSKMGDIHWNPNQNANYGIKDLLLFVKKSIPTARQIEEMARRLITIMSESELSGLSDSGWLSNTVVLEGCKLALGLPQLCNELNKVRTDASGIEKQIEDILNLPIADTLIRRTRDAYKSSPLRDIDLVDMVESFVETYNSLE